MQETPKGKDGNNFSLYMILYLTNYNIELIYFLFSLSAAHVQFVDTPAKLARRVKFIFNP